MFANTAFSKSGNLRETRRSLLSWDWLLGLCLIGIILIAYGQTWHAGFIWDDESHLTQNPCIVGPLGLKEIWTSTQAVYYPLVLTTFWILHKFFGLNPSPYHMLNVLMHAGSAALLWRVLRQLNVRGAWLGAALWALHPVMVQSVAWVTELKNTQSCLFYLLSIFCFLKVDANETSDRVRWWRFGWALLFFVLAIVSKPSTVMLPGVLALCVWWRRGRIRWRDIANLIPFVLISALASAWTIWEQKFHSGASGAEWAQTWPDRLIIAGRAIWFYLGKLVWPHPLIFIYPRWEISSSHLAYLPLLAALAGLFALWLIRRKWKRPVFFAAAYFVISLFPVLGFFNVYFFRFSFVSDHFQYLASMGPLALAGAGITEGMAAVGWKSFLRSAICGVILFGLGVLTWRQSAIYRDVVTLYTTTLAKNPGCWMAHYNLAIALRANGETDPAIAHYRQAVALRPDYAEAHYNLGRILVEKGELNEAIAHYEKALSVNPADAEAHNNLGNALLRIGRVNAEAQYNVANALLRKGRTDEAIDHYQKALELQPENADAHTNLGSAFLEKGRPQDAIAQYRGALQVAPENVAAQSNLAWLLATSSDPSMRNGSEALRLAEQANRLSGGNRPVILRILAAAYAENGRFADATQGAERALQFADAQNNSTLVDALRKEIALYQSGLPYHKQPR